MSEYPMLIDGQLVAGAAELDVVNPATEDVFAKAPRADAAQVEQAIAAAKKAFPAWSARSVADRGAVLVAMADAIEQHVEAIARVLTQEQGKPLGNAMHEVGGVAATWRRYAKTDLTPKLVEDSERRRIEIHRTPLGVVAAIIPWNFPVGLFASKVANALITGNTVIAKPAATTPLSTLMIGKVIADIVPAGVLNIVSDANDLGGILTGHPDIRKISFTGSTATGRKVMENSAASLKRVTLELGGNDAAIVLDDADPARTAKGLFGGAFYNSGQVCLAVKRAYVHDSIYDRVVDELSDLARAAVVGDGLQQGTQFGPLQNRMQYDRVRELLDDAKQHGTVAAEGNTPEGPGYFIAPTIVRDISDGTRLVDEEQFGPVLPVIRYTDVEDALERANSSNYGLGGSVWSSDIARAAGVAARLETGSAWVNTHMDLGPDVPFAGAKDSGIGVEHAEEGLFEFTQIHVVNVHKG